MAVSNDVDAGLLAGNVPFIKGGAGPRPVVVFFGANALFRRIDQADTRRYAGQVAPLLPADRAFLILGYPEQPAADDGLDAIVTDLAPVVRSQVGPTTVIGISFGGFVAIRFAARYPDLVDKLILLVSAHRFSDQGRQLIEGQMAALERGDFSTLVRANALLFRRPWYNALVWLGLRRRAGLAAGFNDPHTILRVYQGIFGPDFARNQEAATRIAAETLVIGGTADQYFDATAFHETAALIPSARLELFRGETHMLPIERRRDVARAIAAFLAPA